jgi:carbamoyltransferase
LRRFQELTGCAVLVNTSFNVRGEPIVCTPADAYRCFMNTGLDVLVMENHLVLKSEQTAESPKKQESYVQSAME